MELARPPLPWQFDARAIEAVGAIAVDAACLRSKAETDPAFGYALMKRVAVVLLERLQATRSGFSTSTGRRCALTR